MKTPTTELIAQMSDEVVLGLIHDLDMLERPLSRRFEGDDDRINALMAQLELAPNLTSKLLIGGALMREALHRGLQLRHLDN